MVAEWEEGRTLAKGVGEGERDGFKIILGLILASRLFGGISGSGLFKEWRGVWEDRKCI